MQHESHTESEAEEVILSPTSPSIPEVEDAVATCFSRPYGDAPTRMLHRNVLQPWNSVVNTQVPPARFGHTAVVHSDRMILFGGRDSTFHNDMWAYEFAQRVWSQLSPCDESQIPAPRAGHTAVVSTDSMWVFGGNVGMRTADCTNEVWKYGIDTQSWSLVPSKPDASRGVRGECPKPRKGHTAVKYHENLMLVFGGQGTVSDNSVWEFNFETCEWRKMVAAGRAPQERLYHVAEITHDEKMLVFGGRSAKPDGCFYNDLFEFDPNVGLWRQVQSEGEAPSARMCSASIFMNGAFCIFYGGSSAYHGDSYEYDVASNSWRRLVCESSTACTRPTTVVHNNRLTLFGGCSESTYLNATLEIEFEVPSLRELARQWLRQAGVSESKLEGVSSCVKKYLSVTH